MILQLPFGVPLGFTSPMLNPCFLGSHIYFFLDVLFNFDGASLGGSVVKNLPANAGDAGLIPGMERSPGEGNGNPLQYSCLGNPKDRGAWWAIVHRAGQD